MRKTNSVMLQAALVASLAFVSLAPSTVLGADDGATAKKTEEFIIIDPAKPTKLQIFTVPAAKKAPNTGPDKQQVAPTVDPTAQPATPAAKPGAPAAKPNTPAGKPGTTTTTPATAPTPAAPASQPATQAQPDSDKPTIQSVPFDDPEKLKKFLEEHGLVAPDQAAEAAPTPEMLEQYYQSIWRLIGAKYYDEGKLNGWETWYDKYKGKLLTVSDLEKALSSMLEAVGDRWTHYTPKDDIERYQARAKNGIVGLGLNIATNPDGSVRVEFLSYASAAWNSNRFRTGDVLKSIQVNPDDKTSKMVDVAGMPKKEVEELLQQKVGTKINVVIKHDKIEETVQLTFAPDGPQPIALKALPNGVGYIRLPSFGSNQQSVENLGNAFVEGLAKLDERFKGNMQGLVLDLRGNGGGAVDLAKMIATLFIEKGSFIQEVERTGRNPKKSQDSFAAPMPYTYVGVPPEVVSLLKRLQTMPMVVLVNGSSASSSEILTSVLMDNHRATSVGTQTFGKAVAFIVQPSPAGGFIQVTVMHYLTPNGNDIANVGITPEVVLDNKRGANATDDQLAKATLIVTDAIAKLNATTAVTPVQQGEGFGGDSVLWISISLGAIALIVVLSTAFHRARKKRDEAERNQK